jgi:hypothetical protein
MGRAAYRDLASQRRDLLGQDGELEGKSAVETCFTSASFKHDPRSRQHALSATLRARGTRRNHQDCGVA